MGELQRLPRALRAVCALEIPFLLYEQGNGFVPDIRNLQVINFT